jgi:hypothetical protein
MDQLFSEEQRLVGKLEKVIAQGRKSGSASEMAESLRSDLKAIWDQGCNEGQAGRDLLGAVDRPDRHGNHYRRSDKIVMKGGQEVEAADLLRQQALALMSRQQKWYALGRRLEGSSPTKDHVPQDGSLIDQLEKGEITTKVAASRIESVLQRDYSPLGAEAFEGAPRQMGLDYLRGVLGRENFQAALHPEREIEALQNQVRDLRITIPKGRNGKPVSSPEAVRERIMNGEKPPEGVKVNYDRHPESSKSARDAVGITMVLGGLGLFAVGCAATFTAPAALLLALPCLPAIGSAAAGIGVALGLAGASIDESSGTSSQPDLGIADPGNPNSPFHPANPSNPINLLMR